MAREDSAGAARSARASKTALMISLASATSSTVITGMFVLPCAPRMCSVRRDPVMPKQAHAIRPWRDRLRLETHVAMMLVCARLGSYAFVTEGQEGVWRCVGCTRGLYARAELFATRLPSPMAASAGLAGSWLSIHLAPASSIASSDTSAWLMWVDRPVGQLVTWRRQIHARRGLEAAGRCTRVALALVSHEMLGERKQDSLTCRRQAA